MLNSMCFIYSDFQYFMRFAQFYARQFSSLAGFYPDRGGVEVTGQTASLLAKAVPSLQHHSSIGS